MHESWKKSEKLPVLSDQFLRYRSSKNFLLGRQIISRLFQYRGPHVEKWNNYFLENIPQNTRITIDKKKKSSEYNYKESYDRLSGKTKKFFYCITCIHGKRTFFVKQISDKLRRICDQTTWSDMYCPQLKFSQRQRWKKFFPV